MSSYSEPTVGEESPAGISFEDSPPEISCLEEGVPEPGLDIGGAREVEPVDLMGWRRTGDEVSNLK